MSDKVLRAINKGRRKAGLKPIRRKTKYKELSIEEKNKRSFVSGVDWITVEKRLKEILRNPKLSDAQKKKAFDKEYNKHTIYHKGTHKTT